MMSPLTCSSCSYSDIHSSPAEGLVQKCHHPESRTFNVVYGGTFYRNCDDMRNHACGPDGDLWEQDVYPPPKHWWDDLILTRKPIGVRDSKGNIRPV